MTNVTIAENGIGVPVRPVDKDAPTLRLTTGGMPIVISDLGAPFIVDGYTPTPPVDFTDGADYQIEFG